MLFTTGGGVWDVCARCVTKTDMAAVGCGRCLGPTSKFVGGGAGVALSTYCGDNVVGIRSACFPYDLSNDH